MRYQQWIFRHYIQMSNHSLENMTSYQPSMHPHLKRSEFESLIRSPQSSDTADCYSQPTSILSSTVYCITLCSFACHYSIIIRKSEKGSHLWPLFDCVKRASWKVNRPLQFFSWQRWILYFHLLLSLVIIRVWCKTTVWHKA